MLAACSCPEMSVAIREIVTGRGCVCAHGRARQSVNTCTVQGAILVGHTTVQYHWASRVYKGFVSSVSDVVFLHVPSLYYACDDIARGTFDFWHCTTWFIYFDFVMVL